MRRPSFLLSPVLATALFAGIAPPALAEPAPRAAESGGAASQDSVPAQGSAPATPLPDELSNTVLDSTSPPDGVADVTVVAGQWTRAGDLPVLVKGRKGSPRTVRVSSVTGRSFHTGAPFDVGRVSDFDVALAGEDIFGAAQSAGIGLRSGGIRTGPLGAVDLEQLGLTGLRADLSDFAGRDVNFMIFRNLEDALDRGPSIGVPGP